MRDGAGQRPAQLGEAAIVLANVAAEQPAARRGEGHPNPPPVLAIGPSPHEAGSPAAVHEADRALVQDLEAVRQVLHGRGRDAEAADEEEQLVLGRGDPGPTGRLLREAEEPAQGSPEARQTPIPGLLEATAFSGHA